MNLTSVLLAGGRNRRMNGLPKWDLQLGGKPLLVHSLLKLKEISNNVVIITSGEYKFDLPESIDVKVIYDQTPYLGPLYGIHTALKNSKDMYHFIIAADMPFFSIDLGMYMLELAQMKNVDLVIPSWNDKLQPLHGIYSKKLLPSIITDLSQGKYSLIKWIMEQKNIFILEDNVEQFNKNGQVFFNMNNPDDYKKALSLSIKEEESE